MRGLFITGTDTSVGKTVLSAALLGAMAAAGERVSAHKPAVTGLDDAAIDSTQPPWPPDHELLGAAAGMAADEVAPLRYGPAVSPLLASELAGETLQARRVLAAGAAAVADRDDGQRTVIVEGVGGLLSPLAENLTVCDLAVALRLPLLIAARVGLGTINHTLLTLQAARAAGLSVRAVVLTPWPELPSRLEQLEPGGDRALRLRRGRHALGRRLAERRRARSRGRRAALAALARRAPGRRRLLIARMRRACTLAAHD